MKSKKWISNVKVTLLLLLVALGMSCHTKSFLGKGSSSRGVIEDTRPRVIISSDIGGTDPDDFQSMIHLLMYADLFNIEGLISSPFGKGRKKDFLKIIDLYEKDLPRLQLHGHLFPESDELRKICKQGAIPEASYKGYSSPTEGSDWIIKRAKIRSNQPLWILVWGGLEDLAQALHDAPSIKQHIRVYWIGGPNKKWSINAYTYIAQNHPDLWMIEANATYRGWFMTDKSSNKLGAKEFYKNYIAGGGAMGADFVNYYKGEIKMGDSPSLAYLMNGDVNDPTKDSWGGSFVPIGRSARTIFYGNSTNTDTIATYTVVEWRFKGLDRKIHPDSTCFMLTVNGQSWPGYHIGKGMYAVRYSPKQVEKTNYFITSSLPELNGQRGSYVSIAPWPGKPGPNDFLLGKNWFGDRSDASLFLGEQKRFLSSERPIC